MWKYMTLAACLAAPLPGQAETPQRNCAARSAVIERLGEQFGESRQSIGLGTNNSVVEVFASASTGTWTITVTLPNGLTCLVASGHAFEQLDELPVTASEDA